MSNSAAIEFSAAIKLLRASLKLCAKFLDGQSDPTLIKELSAVIEEIETAIDLLERDGSAIPLGK